MKNRFYLAMILFGLGSTTLSALAEELPPIPLEASYTRAGARKDVVARRISAKSFYYRVGLSWANFDPSLHQLGFRLGQARNLEIVRPALPEGCEVSKVARPPVLGFMNGYEGQGNFLGIVLEGESCAEWGAALIQVPAIFLFHGVPSSDMGLTYPKVRLSITETIL